MALEQQNTPLRILVVDDNEELVFLIGESLRRLGHYQVETASDGIEGLRRFYELRPDCMVIDVKMPGLDGYQLVRLLRGDPDSEAMPIVMLTALVQDRDRFDGLSSGADRYLTKPARPTEIVAAIREALAASEEDRIRHFQELSEDFPFLLESDDRVSSTQDTL